MSLGSIDFHASRYPEAVVERMRQSLRSRCMDHQFHYVTERQASRWLALHERYSPSRRHADCGRMYEEAFDSAARECSGPVQLIGLGCGGGRKDARLLRRLQTDRHSLRYVAADVSPALVKEAREYVQESLGIPLNATRGLVADFMSAKGLDAYWRKGGKSDERQLFSFLGMMPNFEPDEALGLLSGWLGAGDILVLSANLAPGDDYEEGCRRVLPQYDNIETRHWLITVMEDLGVTVGISDVEFRINDYQGVKRIEAELIIPEDSRIVYEGVEYLYNKEERFRLFYSNRFQPAQLDRMLKLHGFEILCRSLTDSEEEGAWVVKRNTNKE